MFSHIANALAREVRTQRVIESVIERDRESQRETEIARVIMVQ